jgi:hypothetical protein
MTLMSQEILTIQDAIAYITGVVALEEQGQKPRDIASIIVGNMLVDDRVDELCQDYPLLSEVIEEAANLEWLNGYNGEGHLDVIRQLLSALKNQVEESER